MAVKTNVLILGAGFAGTKAALELSGDERFKVTLVSDSDHFRYYPALYRSATGGSRQISHIPLKDIFDQKNVELVRDTAVGLDRQKRLVRLGSGRKLGYDKLIVALGMVTNYMGIKGLEKYSFGIKSIEEAEGLKLHLHQQLTNDKRPDLHYIVVGAGPTGVELAGALPAYLRRIISQHGLPHKRIEIELFEAAGRVLPHMPKDVSRRVAKRLRKLGVDIHLNQKVGAETADTLMVNGKPIKSQTVVWTAGVMNNLFFAENGFSLTEHHKVGVSQYLEAEEDIYVLGDNADTPYSGMAQTALYDGVFTAENLIRQADGRKLRSYRPKRPIYVTPVGRGWAAVLWGKTRIYGRLGWAFRRLADLIAYNDYQPWWEAAVLWQAEKYDEERCPLCGWN